MSNADLEQVTGYDLVFARRDAGLTMEDLAALIGVGLMTISRYEGTGDQPIVGSGRHRTATLAVARWVLEQE